MKQIISQIKDIYSQYESKHLIEKPLKKASINEIFKFEKLIKGKLPENYLLYLTINDFHFDFYKEIKLWDLEMVQIKWLEMRPLADSELMSMKADAHLEGFMTNWDNKQIQFCWWDKAWIPIAGNDSGTLICIDLAPGINGIKYQLLNFDQINGPAIETRWSSFDDYLIKHLDYLKRMQNIFE
jgi:cell wall assembly regulator SMI1